MAGTIALHALSCLNQILKHDLLCTCVALFPSPVLIPLPHQGLTHPSALSLSKRRILSLSLNPPPSPPTAATFYPHSNPDLTRVTIEGADHWLHHQKPQEVAEAILNWL